MPKKAFAGLKISFLIIAWVGCSSAYALTPLDVFINDILECNPAIHAAVAKVSAAKAREHAASFYLYNPELNAEYQNGIERTRSVGINQAFDWANKRSARRTANAANACVAEAELNALRQQLIVTVLDALAKYDAAKKIVLLAKKRADVLKQFVGITNKRYKTGDIARVDLDLAQLAYAESLAQEAVAEVNLNEALQILRGVTGVDKPDWPKLPAALPQLILNCDAILELTAHAPITEIFQQQYMAAHARIALAERERYPDPTFGIQGGYQEESGERKKLFGLTLSIPLYILNPYRAEVDAAHFDAMQASQNTANIFRLTRAEITGSAERYQILYRAARRCNQISAKPLSDGMELIQRLWRAGEITTTDYLVQLKQRIDSQIASVEIKGRAWQAWVEWLKTSGQAESWVFTKHCI